MRRFFTIVQFIVIAVLVGVSSPAFAFVAPGSCHLEDLKTNFSCETIRQTPSMFLRFPNGEIQLNTFPLIQKVLRETERGERIDEQTSNAIYQFAITKQTYVTPETLFGQLKQRAEFLLARLPVGANRAMLIDKIRSMKLFYREAGDASCDGVNMTYPSAAYEPTYNAIGLCPVVLRYNKIAMALLMGHEMAHSLDPSSVEFAKLIYKTPDPTRFGPKPYLIDETAYAAACSVDLHRHAEGYDPQLRVTYFDPRGGFPFAQYLGPVQADYAEGPPRMTLEYQRLQSLDPQDICKTENQEAALKQGVAYVCAFYYRPRCIDKVSESTEHLCVDPAFQKLSEKECRASVGEEIFDGYRNEWFADYLGSLIVDDYLAHERQQGRTYHMLVDQVLPIFYHDSCDNTRIIANKHPLGQTRIETSLSGSPELRKIVGCSVPSGS